MPDRDAATGIDYAGADLLTEIEANLPRYNTHIVDLIAAAIGSRDPNAPPAILDFGCGIGTLSRIPKDKTGLVADGVELDDRQRGIFAARGFAGAASLDDLTRTYDLIFSSNVLEHIPDDREILKQLHARLKPGGRLVLYVPAFRLLWTSLDDEVGHHRRYTKAELAGKLGAAGFRVQRVGYVDSVGFVLALAFRLLGAGGGIPSARSLRLFDRVVLPLSIALDRLCGRHFGKNVFAVAITPGEVSGADRTDISPNTKAPSRRPAS
jgi:SAM-dependent methyltransferase